MAITIKTIDAELLTPILEQWRGSHSDSLLDHKRLAIDIYNYHPTERSLNFAKYYSMLFASTFQVLFLERSGLVQLSLDVLESSIKSIFNLPNLPIISTISSSIGYLVATYMSKKSRQRHTIITMAFARAALQGEVLQRFSIHLAHLIARSVQPVLDDLAISEEGLYAYAADSVLGLYHNLLQADHSELLFVKHDDPQVVISHLLARLYDIHFLTRSKMRERRIRNTRIDADSPQLITATGITCKTGLCLICPDGTEEYYIRQDQALKSRPEKYGFRIVTIEEYLRLLGFHPEMQWLRCGSAQGTEAKKIDNHALIQHIQAKAYRKHTNQVSNLSQENNLEKTVGDETNQQAQLSTLGRDYNANQEQFVVYQNLIKNLLKKSIISDPDPEKNQHLYQKYYHKFSLQACFSENNAKQSTAKHLLKSIQNLRLKCSNIEKDLIAVKQLYLALSAQYYLQEPAEFNSIDPIFKAEIELYIRKLRLNEETDVPEKSKTGVDILAERLNLREMAELVDRELYQQQKVALMLNVRERGIFSRYKRHYNQVRQFDQLNNQELIELSKRFPKVAAEVIACEKRQNFNIELQQTDLALSEIFKKKIIEEINIYHNVLGGKTISMMAIANHKIPEVLMRLVGGVVSVVKKLLPREFARVLEVNFKHENDINFYVNNYVKRCNERLVRDYWRRAIKNQIKNHPRTAAKALIQALQANCEQAINYVDRLIVLFPEKYQTYIIKALPQARYKACL